MKPIEPGCLVLIVASVCSATGNKRVGKALTVESQTNWQCDVCSQDGWMLSDYSWACATQLLRIDDDPDAVTEPEQHEVEA